MYAIHTCVAHSLKSPICFRTEPEAVTHTHLSRVSYSEGTLNIGRQVFELSNEERDAKNLLQQSGGELSLQLLIGVRITRIQGASGFEESEKTKQGT